MKFPSCWNSIWINGFSYMSCLTLRASMKAGPFTGILFQMELHNQYSGKSLFPRVMWCTVYPNTVCNLCTSQKYNWLSSKLQIGINPAWLMNICLYTSLVWSVLPTAESWSVRLTTGCSQHNRVSLNVNVYMFNHTDNQSCFPAV